MSMAKINPLAIKQAATHGKSMSLGGESNFGTMMDAIGAMEGTAATAANMYSGVNTSTVLSAAFSGVNQYRSMSGGGVPSFASGKFNSNISTPPGMSADAAPGTGLSQAEMISSMNQNNLHLLELQATMQSNMQAWNTRSNILSADHRARMAMIEKFTARG